MCPLGLLNKAVRRTPYIYMSEFLYVGIFQSVLPPGLAAVRWLFGHSSPSIDLLVRDSPNDPPSVPHCLNDKAYDIQEKADSSQHT